ncbi:MAG: hypothetical protein RI897_4569, partial [Verrucomicrobiota bacterium]
GDGSVFLGEVFEDADSGCADADDSSFLFDGLLDGFGGGVTDGEPF